MNGKSGAFGLVWTNGKQGKLAGDGILTLAVGLLALALAVVVIAVVLPLGDHEASMGTTAGAAHVLRPDEAFVRMVALTGQNPAGYTAVGPCSAPVGGLSMSPTEAAAYAGSLAQAGPGDEAFVRSVALTGQNATGYAAAGPCGGPSGSLSMSPTEAAAYAGSLAQVGPGDGAFVRSVALTGQNATGYAAAGPCGGPSGSLSMSPTEAAAYAGSLAQVGPGDGAFVRSVALTGQNATGYAAAGPCSAPSGSLSMSPTEAAAYAWSLAQAGQGTVALVGGQ